MSEVSKAAQQFLASFRALNNFAEAIVDYELADAAVESVRAEKEAADKDLVAVRAEINQATLELQATKKEASELIFKANTDTATAKSAAKAVISDAVVEAQKIKTDAKAIADASALAYVAAAQEAGAKLGKINDEINAAQVELDRINAEIASLKAKFI